MSINNEESIAIIAFTGRFPGAKNIEQFWENLKNGVESVSNFDVKNFHTDEINKNFIGADAVLDDIDLFDAKFFDFSPREAEVLDPQHRLFLEACWEVMEKAGYVSEKYDGKISIFGGSNFSSYLVRNLFTNPGLVEGLGTFKTMLSNGQDFLTTRVSYKMNLTGPSVNVCTLCSSSLVAVHYACENLINYQCDIALAGGVNIQVSKNESFFYQEGGIGAADGHCHAFDASANGTVSGSGLGVIVLKRLEDALRDGDTIHAIIRGSAVNNDGANKNSYTAPNPDGQAECIAEAIAMSGINPENINYVEAHGTGTNLGDPIEVAALTRAFRSHTQKKQYCALGSVKTNIGHLVTAGGIASLIKTILSINHHQIPPSLNFVKPNPKIDFDNSPFFVNTKLTEWKPINNEPLRAGVSSFGIGGTNVHVILEESNPMESSGKGRSYSAIMFSAKTNTALEMMSKNILHFIEDNPEMNISDMAYTLQIGRRDFDYRKLIICQNIKELKEYLQDNNPGSVFEKYQKRNEQPVVFAFPEENIKFVEKAKSIYFTENIFKENVDKCFNILSSLSEDDYQKYFKDSKSGYPVESAHKDKTIKMLSFIIQYSLAQLWISWGIIPDSFFGEGAGRYVAHCIAENATLEEILKLLVSDKNQNMEEKLSKKQSKDSKKSIISSQKELFSNEDQIYIVFGGTDSIEENFTKNDKMPIIFIFSKALTEQSADKCLIDALGQFWLFHGNIDWQSYYSNEKRHRILLPTYPFEKERYWIEPGNLLENNDKKKKILIKNDADLSAFDEDYLKNAKFSVSIEVGNGNDKMIGKNEYAENIIPFKKAIDEFCKKYFSGQKLSYNISPVEVIINKIQTGMTNNNIVNQLLKKERPDLSVPYKAPESETEKIITDKWQEILGIENIGMDDNFYELGGHSLLAASIATSLSEHFKLQLPLSQLMEYPTVAKLAEMIDLYKWASQGKDKIIGDTREFEDGEI